MLRALLLSVLFLTQAVSFAKDTVSVLNINGPITATTKDYIQSELAWANANHISAIVATMDTPGGMLNITNDIVSSIINQPIPFITFVHPGNAKAASAGTFIMYASHLAAMSPGTTVGAASPVTLSGSSENTSDNDNTLMKKITNITVKDIRNLAIRNHRNADWAEQAITEADVLNETEALAENVINLIAPDVDGLINQLNGQTVYLNDKAQTLSLKDPVVVQRPMSWRLTVLSFLTQPEVAYGLLLLGIYAIFFELYSPGAIVPGVLGVICLLLAAYAFQFLPIEGSGLALLIAGCIMLISELFVTSYGILGIAGVIAIGFGTLMLFDPGQMSVPFSTPFLISVFITAMGFIALLARIMFLRKGTVPSSGTERLRHLTGTVIHQDGQRYIVLIEGERWGAICDTPLNIGDEVSIQDTRSLLLKVTPIKPHKT